MEMFLSMKMEHWSECLDRYLEGVVIGLGIAIFITICTAVTDLYYLEKQMAYEQSISDAEFEKRLQEIEGWSE